MKQRAKRFRLSLVVILIYVADDGSRSGVRLLVSAPSCMSASVHASASASASASGAPSQRAQGLAGDKQIPATGKSRPVADN